MIDIQFPNSSRSFDEAKSRICFWGYDRTAEISFYIGREALQSLGKDVGSAESELLAAFDATLNKIRQVAAKVYSNGNRGRASYSCVLAADDF
jgi:hypothetical protein